MKDRVLFWYQIATFLAPELSMAFVFLMISLLKSCCGVLLFLLSFLLLLEIMCWVEALPLHGLPKLPSFVSFTYQWNNSSNFSEIEAWHNLAKIYTRLTKWQDAKVRPLKVDLLIPHFASKLPSTTTNSAFKFLSVQKNIATRSRPLAWKLNWLPFLPVTGLNAFLLFW